MKEDRWWKKMEEDGSSLGGSLEVMGRENHKENRDLGRTMQAKGREERGVTCRRRQHLRRSSKSK